MCISRLGAEPVELRSVNSEGRKVTQPYTGRHARLRDGCARDSCSPVIGELGASESLDAARDGAGGGATEIHLPAYLRQILTPPILVDHCRMSAESWFLICVECFGVIRR